MNGIQNKHGPDIEVGIPVVDQPRDGTERKLRDEMMPMKDILLNGYKYLIIRQPIDIKIHGKPFFRWRFNGRKRPALMTG
jgi:hypothetical protein